MTSGATSHPVFISYARKTSLKHAEALHEKLGGDSGPAFLDTSDIEAGDRFPKAIAEALLDARVVVVFADDTYFQRWYCIRELRTALAPFDALVRRPGRPKEELEDALNHIVVALPASGPPPTEMARLPSDLRTTHWLRADNTADLAEQIESRLRIITLTIGEVLRSIGADEAVRARFLEEASIPPPLNLRATRLFPIEVPPSIGDVFMGRANDLWRIHDALWPMPGEVQAGAALTGALEAGGGFGKTRLALEYFHRFGPVHYPGGLFWVNADVTDDELERRFHGILRALKPDTPELLPFRESRRNAAEDLANALHDLPPEQPVLFVVDNIPEPPLGKAPKPLATWCPALGKVAVLATSRRRVSLGDASVRSLPIGTLEPEAAVALLTRDVNRSALDESSWRRIAEWVGHLPLALELLQCVLKAGGLEPARLLELVDEPVTKELDHMMSVLKGQVPDGALRGVTETLSVSYQRLSPSAQRAARLIAQLSPEPIPVALLEALGPEATDFAVRTTLLTRSFVTSVSSDAVSVFGRMHRVLADFLRTLAVDSENETLTVCNSLNEVMDPDHCRDPVRWPLMNACLPHAECVLKRMRGMTTREAVESAVTLGLCVGILLGAEGSSARARAVEESTIELASPILGEEHAHTLAAMNNLAETLRAQGDLAGARSLGEQVLAACRRILGEEHPGTLSAISNLAVTLQQQGELAGARSLQEQVLAARQRILGEEHPDTLTTMSNLAETLHAQGELARAQSLQEQVLAACRRVLGEEHPDTLTTMSNLAGTLKAQGDLAGARRLQKQVLAAFRRILGEEHPHTLTVMSNLAGTIKAEGDLTRARRLLKKVLPARRRILGEEHPDTLTTMENLATILCAQGDLAGARRLLTKVLAARRRILGEEHPDTLTAMDNLAETLRAQGDLAGARRLQKQVLAARQQRP